MESKPSRLTRDTLIPLGLVASVLLGFGGGAVTFHLWAVQDALWKQQVATELTAVKDQLAKRSADDWSRTDQRAWSARLRESNPEIVVPPVPDHGSY